MKKIMMLMAAITFMALPAMADYSDTRRMDIEAEDIERLTIDCGAGFLEIEGVDGLDKIEVKAEIIIENADRDEAEKYIEKHMELDLSARGSSAILKAGFDNGGFLSRLFDSDVSPLIDLTVKTPPNVELRIDDGSGYITIRKIDADIDIDDGSGEIDLERIRGMVFIEDGSGSIEVKDVIGEVEIEDGSGSIEIVDVDGDVEVDDGSGSIDIYDIEGTVTVDDGSGDIDIDGVGEDVRIIDDGSGDCSITNVDGYVDR